MCCYPCSPHTSKIKTAKPQAMLRQSTQCLDQSACCSHTGMCKQLLHPVRCSEGARPESARLIHAMSVVRRTANVAVQAGWVCGGEKVLGLLRSASLENIQSLPCAQHTFLTFLCILAINIPGDKDYWTLSSHPVTQQKHVIQCLLLWKAK